MSETSGRLAKRGCIITGAASGIGRATCSVFAQEGARVICADFNFDGAKLTANSCGSEAIAVELDVSCPQSWNACMDVANVEFGGLDILVNCAGIGRNGDFEAFSLADWNDLVAVNLTGTFIGCQMAMAVMRPQTSGVIINLSSIAATLGGADIAAYCATKGGVSSLTKAVAMHGAPYGVRVCELAPTYVDTELLDNAEIHFPSRQKMLGQMAELIPLGRVAKPLEIANAILLLASDEAAMITGSTLFVDGGQNSGMPSRHSQR